MKKIEQIDGCTYLKYLLRFGLDKGVYNDYKRWGIISCSERNCANNKVKAYNFVDYAGIEDEWLEKIVDVENENEIKVFHILHTLTDEFVCMYCNNYDYRDYKNFNARGIKHIEEEKNYENFIRGETQCFRYYPKTNEIKFGSVKFKVKMGAIIEK